VNPPERIGVVAVVVTWNRAELLVRSLFAILGQTAPPDRVLVVDNASTDETASVLGRQFDDRVDVISLRENVGGAGGFAAGIVRALEYRPDAVWLMDDDTIPEPTALQALLDMRRAYSAPGLSIVASRVVWTDGRDHPMNTPRAKPGARRAEQLADRAVGATPIR